MIYATIQTCPICDGKIARRCRCLRSDCACINGHEWHYCEQHPWNVVLAASDHAQPGCSCVSGKTFTLELRPVEGGK